MTVPGASKDVQEELLQSRKRNRDPGDVPYPVQFSHNQLAYDNWNQMFLKTVCRSITMHQFDAPPSCVLDLGCGSGLWVLEAARQWTSCKFVGFDIFELQPNLGRSRLADGLEPLDIHDLAARIKWVHGNVLEPLPFESGQFDFVRICSIGLGIPEDEWQDLLQEVSRVLRPGGVVEIIEEDPIFPSGYAPKHKSSIGENSFLSVPPPSIYSTYANSVTSPSAASMISNTATTLSYVSDTMSSLLLSQISPLKDDASVERNTDSATNNEPPLSPLPVDINTLLNPRDHSKLKEAWQNMLLRRFLAPRLVTVLPFYLSSEFKDFKTHQPLHIPLPPNSDTQPFQTYHNPFEEENLEDSPGFYIDLRAQSVRKSTDSSPVAEQSSILSRNSKSPIMSAWASMHLARAVGLIQGCKDAIWEEYEKLPCAYEEPHVKGINVRYEFDVAWANWENDMKDRMGLRNKVNYSLAWKVPEEKDRPDWRIWRDRVGSFDTDLHSLSSSDSVHTVDSEVCRSLRGFVAWKADSKKAQG